VDDLIDVDHVDLASAITGDRVLDVFDELRELGAVVRCDAPAGRTPLGRRRLVHGAIV
jgi:hypothetical protein